MRIAGSSPRAWGTRESPRLSRRCVRFIPTGVGNTAPRRPRPSRATVHPHGRGEHAITASRTQRPNGSSPRAWGTQPAPPIFFDIHRFIPTGVGNTKCMAEFAQCVAVHPHGRGEHGYSKVRKLADYGSSPRAWGTHRKCGDRHQISPVHPHGRGEHASTALALPIRGGSSPRAWGTQRQGTRRDSRRRFIPTGVGNTSTGLACGVRAAVHPHGRGEHPGIRLKRPRRVGSSPRAWGTRPQATAQRSSIRFIPTGVGNTYRTRRQFRRKPVHPHGRGEHRKRLRITRATGGSSPRAWGTHVDYRSDHLHRRFIPTGVGNTDHARIG